MSDICNDKEESPSTRPKSTSEFLRLISRQDEPGERRPGSDVSSSSQTDRLIDPLSSVPGGELEHRGIHPSVTDTDRREDRRDTLPSREIRVIEARELGVFPLPADNVTTRDGGNSTVITDSQGNQRILYLFGDTVIRHDPLIKKQGHPYILSTNTVATAALDAPLVLKEQLDKDGRPPVFVPYTAEEQRFLSELAKVREQKIPLSEADERFKGCPIVFCKRDV